MEQVISDHMAIHIPNQSAPDFIMHTARSDRASIKLNQDQDNEMSQFTTEQNQGEKVKGVRMPMV